jgi:formate hydrogenlyase transcriptional activator
MTTTPRQATRSPHGFCSADEVPGVSKSDASGAMRIVDGHKTEISDLGSLDSREIVGQSLALRAVLREVAVVAPTTATVLIQGETGTGKELVARAIHDSSPRHARAFVKINCAAIPGSLLESELFGHERGAFTGAIARKIGRVELAHEGTLFLDEVGDLPLELQPKLHRVLQEHEFERLGGTQTRHSSVRIVAATCRDLSEMIGKHEFRSDLYYRLNVFPVRLPSLRERREDVSLLVRHFMARYARQFGRRVDTVPGRMMEHLTAYDWPGNIRELQNLIEWAVILSKGKMLHSPLDRMEQCERRSANGKGSMPVQPVMLDDCDREHILRALDNARWIVGGPRGAATLLGLKRTTLISKMNKLCIARKAGAAADRNHSVRISCAAAP